METGWVIFLVVLAFVMGVFLAMRLVRKTRKQGDTTNAHDQKKIIEEADEIIANLRSLQHILQYTPSTPPDREPWQQARDIKDKITAFFSKTEIPYTLFLND